MKNNHDLLNEALDTFQKLRHWIDPDYYREQIMPTVRKIKDQLALIETELWQQERQKKYQQYTAPRPDSPPDHDGLATIPSKLIDATTNFKMFNYEGPAFQPHCKKHPAAPHKHMLDLSQALGRYVCQCEFWEQPDER